VAAAQPGPTYSGCSQIVDPFGVVLAELGPLDGAPDPAVLVADVHPGRVAEVRAALPVLRHRRDAVTAPSPAPASN
jgi:predicted amidohydrolase